MVGATGAAHAGATTTVTSSGDQFAVDVTAAAKRGWRVRDMVVEHRSDQGGQAIHLTMVGPSKAVRYSLGFDPENYSAVHYSRANVDVPTHYRFYRGEKSLLAFLAKGGPTQWNDECGSSSLSNSGGSADVDPTGYFVASPVVVGAAARKLLGSTLASALKGSHELVSISRASTKPPGAAYAIDIELVYTSSIILHIGLDKRHRVVALQRRDSPGGAQWATYRKKAALVKRLAKAGPISSLRFSSGKKAKRVVLKTRGSRPIVVKMRDFETVHTGCGC